ncbi:MAG: orotate phosphoribosyltransferase [Verrucomicrobiota bacterium]
MTPELLKAKFEELGALLHGHFLLRSGRHSRVFFQCAKLLQHPGLCSEICASLAEKAKAHPATCVISPALGGILVGHEVARHLELPHIFVEKKEGKLVMRRFEIDPETTYLIAEDVVTTGSAVQEVVKIVRDAGAKIAAVACIVDRSGATKPDFGAPFISLMEINADTFDPDHLPEDLKESVAMKPGS